jgi:hypothetical protein
MNHYLQGNVEWWPNSVSQVSLSLQPTVLSTHRKSLVSVTEAQGTYTLRSNRDADNLATHSPLSRPILNPEENTVGRVLRGSSGYDGGAEWSTVYMVHNPLVRTEMWPFQTNELAWTFQNFVRSVVLTTVIVKDTVLRDMTLCNLV